MAVKYLSEEWAKEVNNRLQASEAVKNAAKGQTITLQQVFTDVPDQGEVKAFFKLSDGSPELGLGETEGPEATITQSYETATAVNKGELQGQAAFMQGKLKIQGNLMKVMQLQGFLQAAGEATKDLEIEYSSDLSPNGSGLLRGPAFICTEARQLWRQPGRRLSF